MSEQKQYRVKWDDPSLFSEGMTLEAEHVFDEDDARHFAWSMLKSGVSISVEEVER